VEQGKDRLAVKKNGFDAQTQKRVCQKERKNTKQEGALVEKPRPACEKGKCPRTGGNPHGEGVEVRGGGLKGNQKRREGRNQHPKAKRV